MNEEIDYKTSHIIGIRYMTEDFIQSILDDASEIKKNPSKYAENLKGKILSLAFWEASTRTRLSFESAMLRLGGKTLGFSSQAGTSIEKGESLSDTPHERLQLLCRALFLPALYLSGQTARNPPFPIWTILQ